MKEQLAETSVTVFADPVVSVLGESPHFEVLLESGTQLSANIVVIATGYKRFDLQFDPSLSIVKNAYSPKDRPSIALSAPCFVRKGLWACGTIAGHHSMLSVAMGSGAETACRILSEIAGHVVLVHDVPGGHKL